MKINLKFLIPLFFLQYLITEVYSQNIISPEGIILVANRTKSSVTIIDVETGNIISEIATEEGPGEIAVSPDGKMAVTANYGYLEDGLVGGAALTLPEIIEILVVLELVGYVGDDFLDLVGSRTAIGVEGPVAPRSLDRIVVVEHGTATQDATT